MVLPAVPNPSCSYYVTFAVAVRSILATARPSCTAVRVRSSMLTIHLLVLLLRVSVGIGRSGTFALVDAILKMVRSDSKRGQ